MSAQINTWQERLGVMKNAKPTTGEEAAMCMEIAELRAALAVAQQVIEYEQRHAAESELALAAIPAPAAPPEGILHRALQEQMAREPLIGTERRNCLACQGNDADAPCAYPSERPAGCLRAVRLDGVVAAYHHERALFEAAYRKRFCVPADAALNFPDVNAAWKWWLARAALDAPLPQATPTETTITLRDAALTAALRWADAEHQHAKNLGAGGPGKLQAALKAEWQVGEAIAKLATHATFQQRVRPWMMTCFGEVISADREERNHRFLEEALELVQACGCSADEAHQLVDYVFGRPMGEKSQEVGGVMVTLAALCLAHDMDMHASGETELARIWTKVEVIRAKQASKPKHGPLPGSTPAAGSAE